MLQYNGFSGLKGWQSLTRPDNPNEPDPKLLRETRTRPDPNPNNPNSTRFDQISYYVIILSFTLFLIVSKHNPKSTRNLTRTRPTDPNCHPKRIVFEDVFSVLDSASLEHLKELTARRRVIEESVNATSFITEATAREMSGGLTSRSQQDIQKLEQYLPLLENFIVQVDSISLNKDLLILELRIQWSSTLSSMKFRFGGPKFFQINSLKYELGMVLFLYGLTVRERAFEVFSEDMQQSASLLRKAAGIYKYLSAEVLPLLQSILPPEKPPETTTNVSSAMNNICLAEAQAIAIRIAEKQGLSNGALAKLHYGVTQFLDEASSVLQSEPKDISRKFLEFIYTCSTLHELKSYRRLAESYKQSEQMGVAIGLLNCGMSKSKNLPGEQSWREAFKSEVYKISDMLKKYNDENAFVWQQKIPLDYELPSLEGRTVVTTTPYEPQRWEREIAFSS